MADHSWVYGFTTKTCSYCNANEAHPCLGNTPCSCFKECPRTTSYKHNWVYDLTNKSKTCQSCRYMTFNELEDGTCSSMLPPVTQSPLSANYWIRGKDEDTCKCPKPVHIRWNGLGWFCDACGKKSSDNSTSYSSPTLTSSCDCGADKVYGEGNTMHSATMPCSAYKKP